jgi:hypothetical protein
MSTNSIVVGTVSGDPASSRTRSSRSSGTGTTPTLASTVQNG